ncbi:MAG: hypothetical protein KTR15_12890 [Phycisphaeraceae bacterium]|nr:hypothetical protein [Phycisphaeraceae bacterium]
MIPQIEGVTLRVVDGEVQIGAAGDADDDGFIEWFTEDPPNSGNYINGPELGGTVPYTLADDEIGRWIHITAVYDGNTWYLYRNGALVQADAHAVGPVSTNADWVIGEFNNLPQQANGDEMVEIDDVRVYNRAMIQDEVRELAAASPMDAENRLVARWDFDNGASDTSLHGTDHAGTLNGGAVVAGGTLTLDGVDDEMRFASTTDISNATVNKRTVLVRFKVDDASSTAKQVIYDEGGSTKGFNIYIEDGSLYVGGWNLASDPTYWAGAWLSTDTVVSGQWHEVALVFDAESTITTNALQAYLDGELFGMADGSRVTAHNDGNAVGRVNLTSRYQDGTTGGSNPFKGEIDYVHVISANASDDDPTLNLVAAWELDGNGADTSPNGLDNSGTVVGTPSYSNGALVLSGDDNVSIPNSTDLNNTLNEQVMIEARFKVTNAASGSRQVIYETGGSSRGMNVYVQSGNLYVGGWNTPGAESGWSGTWLSTDTIQSNVWHEVRVVLNGGDTVGSGAIEGYLDGTRFGEGSGSQIWPNTGQISIGSIRQNSLVHTGFAGAGSKFTGSIDYVRVYKRMAATRDFIDPAELKVYAGRITKVADRNGYSLDVAYKTFTDLELAVSPDRQWQIDTVTDPYGRSMSFTYRDVQVGGLWVVEKVNLPNGEDVDYLYEDDAHLTKVQHADGTESTFVYGTSTQAQTVTVTFDDAAAEGTHRRKTAYLTQNFVLPGGVTEGFEAFNQAAMLIRMLVNGTDEVAYLNFNDPNEVTTNINKMAIYEGSGKLRQANGQWTSQHYKDGWSVSNVGGSTNLSGTLEDTYAFVDTDGSTPSTQDFDLDVSQAGTYPIVENERGERTTMTYWDADGLDYNDTWVRFRNYEDATGETFSYNDFAQVTRYKDREDRVTLKDYDANGNLLKREVGLISNGAGGQAAQPEYAEYEWAYYSGSEGPAVAGISGAANPQPENLCKSATDANGNTTHYVYDANNFLIAQIDPADRVGDDRAVTTYGYDSAGRMQTVTDPLGRVTTFAYDERDRQKTVTYEDGSTSETFYANELTGGAGSLSNLVVAVKDRNDNYTQYRYDGHGRRVTTIRGITTETNALNLSFIPDTTYHDVEECVYLDGTSRKVTCTRNGERTEYVYDFRHRQVATTVYPREEGVFPYNTNLVDPDGAGPLAAGDDPGELVSTTVYRDNLRFASVDPYGRATFYAYRAADSAMIRTVKETVPGGSGIDLDTGTFTDVINLTRDLSYEDAAALGATTSGGGAAYLITDVVKNAVGQTTSTIDPRNIQHDRVYDSRGRTVESVTAVGTTVEAKSETVYDAQSNVIESRSARYFDSGDTEGSNKAFTTMTYTGRNLLATKTVAAGDTTYDTFVTSGGTSGLGAKATQEMFYYLDGTHEKTVDFNGNDPQFTASDHEWLTVWRDCCRRVRATIDPEGHGNAQGTDFNGNVAHTAVVDDLISDVVVDGTTGARTIADSDFNGIPGYWDAPDARTLQETTTRFDSKNRPVASTVWLGALDLVDPNDPPILYSGSVIGGTRAQSAVDNSQDGLTTLYYYSEDLYETPVVTAGVEGVPTRGPSQGNTILVHQFAGAPEIDLQPMLNELSNDDILVLRDDYTNASARATINPEGEISVTIMDGQGRAVISAMLDPTTNAVVTWSTVSHDRVSNAIATSYGDTLETLSISALNHLNRSFTDGAGRAVEAEDAEGNVSFAVYDNNGNAIRTRNANAVGQDCDFDPRNRDISCTDTQGDTTTRTYNDNNQVLKTTDAKLVANKADTVYDARGRAIETTSRLSVSDTNEATYDPNSNLLTQTDAEGNTTTYEYDPRNLRIATLMPGHNPASAVGDSDYDRAAMAYDAMRRPLLKTDQEGDTCVYTYDLASRLLTRDYRTAANSTPLTDGLPTGTIADTDTFTYDDASRPLTAIKGRYSNTVTYTYDNIGRPSSEALTTNGQTYTTGYTTYDDDSRLTTLTYPDGSTVATTYTDRNQAEDIDYDPDGPGGTLPTAIATMTYDVGMREILRDLGNGLETSFSYREDNIAGTRDNMLASITVETAPGLGDRQSFTFDYTYDANKNVVDETRAPGNPANASYNFSYTRGVDAKDRMTSWTRINTTTALDSQAWSLSFEGDWDDTTLTDGGTGTTQTRTHNAPHELLTIDPDGVGGLPAFSQTHDAKGNLTADGDGLAHTFDFDNMLSQTVVSSSSPRGIEGTHSYAYDALGRRVSKTVNPTASSAVTTVFVCAGQRVISEYTGGTASSDPERKYVYSATGYIDEPLALIDATGPSEATYYYHRDRRFNVSGLTDGTGVASEKYTYTAYGEVTIYAADGTTVRSSSSLGNGYTHTGHRLDEETGLHYFRARYHDPALGRFLERDPLGYPDGLNTYAAYHVMYGGVDPSGMQTYQVKIPSQYFLPGGKRTSYRAHLSVLARWSNGELNQETKIMPIVQEPHVDATPTSPDSGDEDVFTIYNKRIRTLTGEQLTATETEIGTSNKRIGTSDCFYECRAWIITMAWNVEGESALEAVLKLALQGTIEFAQSTTVGGLTLGGQGKGSAEANPEVKIPLITDFDAAGYIKHELRICADGEYSFEVIGFDWNPKRKDNPFFRYYGSHQTTDNITDESPSGYQNPPEDR